MWAFTASAFATAASEITRSHTKPSDGASATASPAESSAEGGLLDASEPREETSSRAKSDYWRILVGTKEHWGDIQTNKQT